MNKLIVLALLASTITCDGASFNWKIVGGEDAKEGQFPYQVSIQIGGTHNCGGSILNKETILTAAHCVVGYVYETLKGDFPLKLSGEELSQATQLETSPLRWNPEDVKVVVGLNRLSQPGDTYSVAKLIPHENYNAWIFSNDVGIIKLAQPIEYNDLVQPIDLSNQGMDGGESVMLSGWGTTVVGGETPDKLQFINLVTYDLERCEEQMGNVIEKEHLCTLTKSGEGACHGDSGGPLTFQGKVVGIVSFGRPCAEGYPDVFTRVSYFRDWILKNMETSQIA